MTSCCAHSKITHKTIKDLHGNCADKYYCLTCDTEFIIKPKDKQMENKVIFESEDQARKLFSDIGLIETISIAVDEAKRHGYIRKSPLENKVIFESEEEAIYVLSFLDFCDSNIEKNLKALKRHNLIRKSLVEEAEEMYDNYRSTMCYEETGLRVLVDKLYEAIQYLKAENERLKK